MVDTFYRLLEDTRPDEIGHINPCSENTSRVSQTRRHGALYRGATSLSTTKDQDWGVFSVLTEGYEPVANDKQSLASSYENGLSRLENGPKNDNGRLKVGKAWNENLKLLGDLVEKNAITTIMETIGDSNRQEEVIKMCMELRTGRTGE